MFFGVDIGSDAVDVRNQLFQMMREIGIDPEQVMIANIVKAPGVDLRNLDAEYYRPRIIEMIGRTRPAVVVTLGEAVTKLLIQSEDGIVKLRGSCIDFNGTQLVPTFHPGYVLGRPAAFATSLQDLSIAAKILGGVE